MRLTETKLRNSKPRERPYKMSDGRGLTLIVNPTGSKLWRLRYRFGGVEKMLGLGRYPATSLKRAREKRDGALSLLDENVDPSAERKAEKESRSQNFESVAREWLEKADEKRGAGTRRRARRRLEMFVFPVLGKTPIGELKAKDVLRVLRGIEASGKHETAHRVRSLCSRVFKYAVIEGLTERDITVDLTGSGALAGVKVTHRAAITEPKRIGELLRAIDGYQGEPAVMAALKLLPLVFVRPGELRFARWAEFDLDGAEWRIPAERMKMKTAHLVPLSTQSLEILESLHPITGHGTLVFPSLRSADRPISDNTLNAALRRLGYTKEQQTAHGFRTIASTLLNELGFHADSIELQLAHKPRDSVRAAYNRAERLAERRKMMKFWADYLDGLKADDKATVTAIHA